MDRNYTATIQNQPAYYRGLYTLFSAREKGQPLDCLSKSWNDKIHQVEWLSVKVVWIGIRATENSVSYIIKLEDNSNHYGITYFKMSDGKSLKKYLGLTSKVKVEKLDD